MTHLIAAFLFLLGSFFFVLATVGILKLPDLYTRTSASTKGATLGLTCTLAGVAFYFDDISIVAQIIITILFILVTAPISSHMIGRAAYFVGIPLWEGSCIDELKGHYDKDTHDLESDENTTDPEIMDENASRP